MLQLPLALEVNSNAESYSLAPQMVIPGLMLRTASSAYCSPDALLDKSPPLLAISKSASAASDIPISNFGYKYPKLVFIYVCESSIDKSSISPKSIMLSEYCPRQCQSLSDSTVASISGIITSISVSIFIICTHKYQFTIFRVFSKFAISTPSSYNDI